MTEEESKAVLASLVALDFEVKANHMQRSFSNRKHLLVYSIPPITAGNGWVIVVQSKSGAQSAGELFALASDAMKYITTMVDSYGLSSS
jgi:hypothetical protein